MSRSIPVNTNQPTRRLATGTLSLRSARTTPAPDLADGTIETAASNLDPEKQKQLAKGKILIEKGRVQAAVRLMDELTRQNPCVLEFAVLRSYAVGCLRQAAGDAEDAKKHYRRSLALDPFFEPARNALDDMGKKASLLSRWFGK